MFVLSRFIKWYLHLLIDVYTEFLMFTTIMLNINNCWLLTYDVQDVQDVQE